GRLRRDPAGPRRPRRLAAGPLLGVALPGDGDEVVPGPPPVAGATDRPQVVRVVGVAVDGPPEVVDLVGRAATDVAAPAVAREDGLAQGPRDGTRPRRVAPAQEERLPDLEGVPDVRLPAPPVPEHRSRVAHVLRLLLAVLAAEEGDRVGARSATAHAPVVWHRSVLSFGLDLVLSDHPGPHRSVAIAGLP